MIEKRKPIWKRREWIATGIASTAATLVAQDSDKRIVAGQFGTEHPHASGKMDAMRSLKDLYEVVGVVEPDDARWESVKGKYEGVPRLSEEELFAVKGLQVVAVETDIPDLIETAKKCVSRGLHIHLDKPAGTSLPKFKELHDVAAANQAVIQMGYMLRYNPAFQFLFKALKEDWLGEVFEVDGVMSKLARGSGRSYLKPYSGGVMFELACHLVDAVLNVLGPPDSVTPFLRKTHPDLDQVVDNTLAVFEYPRATATVRSSIVEVGGNQRRQFIVCGTKGTVEIRPLEPAKTLTLTLDEPAGGYKRGRHEIDLPASTGRYDDEFRDLAKIVRGEKKTDYPPAHDLAVHEAVLRASGMPLD